MVVTLLFWLFTFSCLGLTGLASFALVSKSPTKLGPIKIALLGFSVIFLLVGWLSLVIPIGKIVLIGILSVDFLIIAFKKKRIRSIIAHWRNEAIVTPKYYWVLIVATSLVFAIAASTPIGLHDTALYHAQNIRWIQEYAVVPGLGNLHGRFAFNSMFFPVSALFSTLVGETENAHQLVYPVNPVMIILLIAFLTNRIFNALSAKNIAKTALYLFVLIPAMVMYPGWINAPSPDFISAALVIFAFLLLFDFFQKPENIFNQNLLVFLVFAAITVKLSNVFLILLLAPLLRRGTSGIAKRLVTICAMGILILAPFLVRNYVLSGYVVYPFPAIDLFQVDWKIPVDIALEEKNHVANWAKIPHMPAEKLNAMPVYDWLPYWWQAKPLPMKGILLVNVFGILTFVFFLLRNRYRLAWMQFVLLISLAFTFINGPDPRFVHGFLFIGLGMSALAMFSLFKLNFAISPKIMVVILAACVLGGLVKSQFTEGTFLLPAGLDKSETKAVQTNFEYYIPAEKQTCFYNLPCAPVENNNLRLRGESLKSGFRIENTDGEEN